MKNPMVTAVVAVGLAVGMALSLAGCAADSEPTESSSEESPKAPEPSQREDATEATSTSAPKVEDGTVAIQTAKLPPAQRCYNNCRRGGLRDDFCSSACGW